jgi:hypothetical protein
MVRHFGIFHSPSRLPCSDTSAAWIDMENYEPGCIQREFMKMELNTQQQQQHTQ